MEDAAGRGELAFLARILTTTILCSWSGAVAGVAGQAEVGARIASRSVVWWRSCRAERPAGILDGGWLVLSQEFYEEILAHPIPLDRRVLRGLSISVDSVSPPSYNERVETR